MKTATNCGVENEACNEKGTATKLSIPVVVLDSL